MSKRGKRSEKHFQSNLRNCCFSIQIAISNVTLRTRSGRRSIVTGSTIRNWCLNSFPDQTVFISVEALDPFRPQTTGSERQIAHQVFVTQKNKKEHKVYYNNIPLSVRKNGLKLVLKNNPHCSRQWDYSFSLKFLFIRADFIKLFKINMQ